MGLNNKIKSMLTAAGLSGRQLAPLFNSTPDVAAVKISRGIKKIDELIRVCDYCGAKITITTKDGAVIPLTVDDLPQKDAAK